MTGTMKTLIGAAAAFIVVGSANAALVVTSLGTGAPPATVGGLAMTPAIADPGAVFGDVTSAPLTATKSVLFSSSMSHRRVGSGWGSWSHGYMGDVYYSNGASSVTLTFNQADMTAFYFYVESNGFGLHDFSISGTGSGGASAATTASVEGLSGAAGFGFHGTGGTTVTSITITLTGGVSGFLDFAVGEFGWSKVPAPGALALLGVAGLCGRRRRA